MWPFCLQTVSRLQEATGAPESTNGQPVVLVQLQQLVNNLPVMPASAGTAWLPNTHPNFFSS